jgi:stage V sporulation protein D (sporulation-specific penicillin-binding protein)
MKRRIIFLLSIFSLLLILLVIRVGWIQIVKGTEYKRLASEQQTRGSTINSTRGVISDRNGKALALSQKVNTIAITPYMVRKSSEKVNAIANKLAEILGLDSSFILEKINSKNSYETIARKIDEKIGLKVKDWIKEKSIDGIYVDDDTKRVYPFNNLAAHVIGFTGDDNQGLGGVEAMMDKYLKGVPGKVLSEIDAIGIQLPFTKENYISPREGLNVVLTIDETIQYFVDNALNKAIKDNNVKNGATAIVMDPNTGEILALASKPDFDANLPFKEPNGLNKTDWSGHTSADIKLLEKTTWRNKSVVDTYEPGSTFKAIVAAASLEEGVVSPDTVTSDNNIDVMGRTIKCWKWPNVHGTETFAQGLYNSCNPVFVKASQLLGLNKFYKYIRAFGFYDKTGIQLPGEAGSIMHTKPTPLDMAVASFGQRFQITPIQLITAYASIANGGRLLQPQIVKELRDSSGNIVKKTEPVVVRNVISAKTSETLRGLLEKVVSTPTGTGKTAYLMGYRVAGKTGTSETSVVGQYIASFSAFAPADNPQICVLVVLDNPTGRFGHGGGGTAGYVVKEIMDETLNYLQIEKVYSDSDKIALGYESIVPSLTGKKLSEAKNLLIQKGLKYKIVGDSKAENTVVTMQNVKTGVALTKNSIVVLYTTKTTSEVAVTVPNLNNKTINDATEELNALGLNIKISGTGTAMRQSIPAGKKVNLGDIISVEFRYNDPASNSINN